MSRVIYYDGVNYFKNQPLRLSMQSIIKSFVTKHTPPVISLLLAIVWATYHLSNVVNDGFVAMKTDLVQEARIPAYQMLQASLEKQAEKLESDPTDVKNSDIKFLYSQCSGDFGKHFIPSLPPTELLSAKRTCTQLEQLYLDRRVF